MPRPRKWTDSELVLAVQRSTTLREVATCLGLSSGGRTFAAIRRTAEELGLDLSRYPFMVDGRVRRHRRWTDSELHDVVNNSLTLSEVARQLGYEPNGGIHRWLTTHIRRLGINTSHFKGQGWARGVPRPGTGFVKRPLEEILVRHSPAVSSGALRRRLIKEGVKSAKCEECGLDTWRGQPITLQLDHINGDHTDNRLENLRILCPNCHAQTPTWCNKRRCHQVLEVPVPAEGFEPPKCST